MRENAGPAAPGSGRVSDKPASGGAWPLVAIVGPTGSGKSEAGLSLARSQPAEILNCDSLQVYRYLNVGTAKLPPEERRDVPHHLIDVVDPDEEFNAGEYARRARPVLRTIAGAGRLPIVVGGTGFYLRALLDGLFPGPASDRELRENLAVREARRPGFLHRLLRRFDPASAARIHARDTKKLIRAAEVCLLTGKPMSAGFAEGRDRLTGFETLKIVLDPPRGELFGRLDQRAAAMFEQGLVAEVESILARGFPPESKPFESLGYRQALAMLRGEMTIDEAIESTQKETRRYAKRQWTWFRREPDAHWVRGFGDDPRVQSRICELTDGFLGARSFAFSLQPRNR